MLPDATDKATLPESVDYAARRGVVQVEANNITNRGSLVAEGGRMTLNAIGDEATARIYLDEGSTTSVAGHWADVPLSDNLLTFNVTSNELKNSPDQKLGVLRGATVTVDLRKSNPIFDLSGYIAAQARTVEQKAAAGGELTITTPGSIIQRAGATIDASGGGFRYGGGTPSTTRLIGSDGKLYDIGTAQKDRFYASLADTFTRNYERWGQKQVFSGLLYGIAPAEAGYLEGKAGGNIFLSSNGGLVLDGKLKGGVTVGPNQFANAPRGAALKIGALNGEGNNFDEAQRIGQLTFVQSASNSLGSTFDAVTALTQAQKDRFTLSSDQLFGRALPPAAGTYAQDGFDSVEIYANGRVSVPQGVSITGTPGSSFTVRSPEIDVAGTIAIPAGRITLQPFATDRGVGVSSDGVFIASSATLSTAGLWINTSSPDGSFVGDPLPLGFSSGLTSTLNGGSITVGATNQLGGPLLARGAVIDVGGGASFDRRGRVTNGNGGSIT
ncbi:MAG: hypothetical protein ACOYLX_23510, partial [Burkholderiaceae bacterium]